MRHLCLLSIFALISVTVGLDLLPLLKSRSKRTITANLRTMYQNALTQGQNIYNSRQNQAAAVAAVSSGNRPPATYGSFYQQRAGQSENVISPDPFTNQVQSPQIPSKAFVPKTNPGNMQWRVVRNGNAVAFAYTYNHRHVPPTVPRVTGTSGIYIHTNTGTGIPDPRFNVNSGMRPVFNPNTGQPIRDPRFINSVDPRINGPTSTINGPMDPRNNGINPHFNGPLDPRINGQEPINNRPVDPSVIDPNPVDPVFGNTPTIIIGPANPILQPNGPFVNGPINGPGFTDPDNFPDPIALGLTQGPLVNPGPNNPGGDPLRFTRQSDTWFWGGNRRTGPLRGAVPPASQG